MTVTFTRLVLENFKCYESIDVRLDDGVTVIHGLNGSGKSSLLEACFFALYGARALDGTLDEVVTIGAETSTVELWFVHDGTTYHIERSVRRGSDSARTTRCVLTPESETDAVIEQPIEGATDVRAEISALLCMDADAFVNCAYVRQGEVNKLINASPSQRQDMIDELLQLGRLEDYRERASDARVGVGRIRDERRGALSDLTDRISEIESKDLHETRNQLLEQRKKRDEQIETAQAAIDHYESKRDEALDTLQTAKEQREQIQSLEESIESLESAIAETERKRATIDDQRSEHRQCRSDERERRAELLAESQLECEPSDCTIETVVSVRESVTARDEELLDEIQQLQLDAQEQTNRAEQLEADADEREELASKARKSANERASTVEDQREQIERRQNTIERLTARRDRLEATFEDAPCDFGEAEHFLETVQESLTALRERIAETKSEKANAQQALEEANALKEAGNCPECGQPVEGSPHVEAIETRRDRVTELAGTLDELEDQRETLEERRETATTLLEREATIEELTADVETERQLLESDRETLAQHRETIEEHRSTAADHEATATEKRAASKTCRERASEIKRSIGELNSERTTLARRRDRLDALQSALEAIETATERIEQLETRHDELQELNDERRERLTEQRHELADLRDQFDRETLEDAVQQRQTAEQEIEDLQPKLSELQDSRDTLQEKLGAIQNQLETLEQLHDRKASLEETVEELEDVYDETERLQSMYADLRAELRQQNVSRLERLVNETFDVIYQNDSYARIELDGQYALSVYQKDGDRLDPQQLSGGERALFNLSLRCGIYRLLAEGIDASAPMPPLILDEPTVFLDAGHVTRLVDLIGSMRDIGVEQIVVVSHDDELVGAADDIINVQKDATTNRSSVRRQTAGSITT